ncbi:DUF998 domain-containing protein [Shewanella marina]|uniref:DUF998 domain-containing protein n=1 Tax=Shewanella marina TaxID=487319 RepID=UPI00277D1038|nr:DUF998 domain-containing protein [Shewanella marina]
MYSYSALIATLWVTVSVAFTASQYSGYNHSTQFCSELGASGSPTETLSPPINNYPLAILFCLFGFYLIQHNQTSIAIIFIGILIIIHGVGTLVAGYFPMDKDPYTKSPSVNCKIHSWAGFIMLLSLLRHYLLAHFH